MAKVTSSEHTSEEPPLLLPIRDPLLIQDIQERLPRSLEIQEAWAKRVRECYDWFEAYDKWRRQRCSAYGQTLSGEKTDVEETVGEVRAFFGHSKVDVIMVDNPDTDGVTPG